MDKIASGADILDRAFRKEVFLKKHAAVTRPQAWATMRGTTREVGVLDNALHNAADRLKDLRKQLEGAEGADKAKVQDAISGYERHVEELGTKRTAALGVAETRLKSLSGKKAGPLEWLGKKLGIGGNRQHLVEHASDLTAMKHPVVDVAPMTAAKKLGKAFGGHGRDLAIGGGALALGIGGAAALSAMRKRRAARAAGGEQ